jgi:long-chain acyl-CoA synthetase
LGRFGIVRGDRIGILCQNRLEFLVAMFAANRVGAVAVPVNTQLAAAAIASICADAGARLLFADATCRAKLPAGIRAVEFDTELDSFVDPGPHVPEPMRDDDVALQLYTSGSTGKPKGVLLGWRAITWLTSTVKTVRAVVETDVALVQAPLYHKAPLLTVKSTLAAGGTLVLLPRFEVRAFIDAIARFQPTILAGVPPVWSAVLAQTEALERTAVACVRQVFVGSMAPSTELLEALDERFENAAIGVGYGLTEAAAIFGPSALRTRPLNSLGYPLPGVEVRLIAEDGSIVGVGEGVLHVRCPAVMMGYHNRPEETARRLVDGWLDTGDVCRCDDAGVYYFVRRADDMIKCGGEMIYPREVEATLEKHGAVLQAAVVPVRHSTKGHVPVAFIVTRPGTSITEEELKAWFLSVAPAFRHPRRVFVRDRLPLAATQKVDYRALRDEAAVACGPEPLG